MEMRLSIILWILCLKYSSAIIFDASSRTFDEISVTILPNQLNASDCPLILQSIKSVLSSASQILHDELNSKFGRVRVRLPKSWSDDHCYTEPHIKEHQPFDSKNFDIVVGPYDKHGLGQIWSRQSLSCRKRGDFIYIPNVFTIEASGSSFFQQWNRFFFGLFSDDVLASNVTSGSRQDSFCLGVSPASIIGSSGSSFMLAKQPKMMKPPSDPDFIVSREAPPKYVIALENSIAMNNANNSWDLLRTALKKFITEDITDENAQVGMVLFNAAANIVQTVSKIGEVNSPSRTAMSLNIKAKFHLSHKTFSCVRCGIIKAIEALQTSGSTVGANVIVISQGHLDVLSREDERELLALSKKHELRVFSMPLVESSNNVSMLFESLSYYSGGNSFLIKPKPSQLEMYMDIVDSLREIRSRSESNGPALIYENLIKPSARNEAEVGSFVIDQHTGKLAEFQVYTMGSTSDNGFIKTINIKDNRGNSYSQIYDRLPFHYLSVYQVPFELERNIGMIWNYDIDKVQPQNYVVQVVSSPRVNDESIKVKFFTNFQSHSVYVNETYPLKFFVEVSLNSIPIVEARVMLRIRVSRHQSQGATEEFQMELFDNGNGDPDIRGNDGVYSRYFTNLTAGEGRYDIDVLVDNFYGTAFTYQPTYLKESNFSIAKNVKLSRFSRIVKGESLRIMSIAPAINFSPSRILDMSAFVHKDKEEVLLSWTAPGEILDYGRVISYNIYASELSKSFYKRSRRELARVAATQISGSLEKITLKFSQIEHDSFLAIAAVNNLNKMGELSNVVHVKLPQKIIQEGLYSTNGDDVKKEHIPQFGDSDAKKSDKVLFYVLFAIIVVVLVSIIAVVFILKKYQGSSKQSGSEDPMDDLSVIDVTEEVMMVTNEKHCEPMLTGYRPNHSILKPTNIYNSDPEELCNCHEIGHDDHPGLVINPYINYSQYFNKPEPIYQNQAEVSRNYPIYSVVNKANKNVRIQLNPESVTTEDESTEAETEPVTDEERCLTPSNTFLEVSFDAKQSTFPGQIATPQKLQVLTNTSTPNAKVRTITQV